MRKASSKLTKKFCKCVKKVSMGMKQRKEGLAIAICVKSVLQTKGKTLKKFNCRGNKLFIQPKKV